MKTWKIKTLETKLNKEIKRDYLSFGLDIALKVTGFAMVKTTATTLTVIDKGIIDTTKEVTITDRLDNIEEALKNITIPKNNQKVGVIEMPFVGFNRNTAIVLGLSSGVAYSVVKEKFPYSFFIRATHARQRIGLVQKKCKKKDVQKYIKDLMNFEEDENIVDGLVLALAGLIVRK